jgi:hypothetical protein
MKSVRSVKLKRGLVVLFQDRRILYFLVKEAVSGRRTRISKRSGAVDYAVFLQADTSAARPAMFETDEG